MRKCLTKFSLIFEWGAVSSPEPCASSGGRLPEAFFLVFRLEFQGAKVHCAPSFRYSSRPRCFAAAWWFRLRSRVLRPEDACQKRFSWFSDWSPEVEKCAFLLDSKGAKVCTFSISVLFSQKTHKCKSRFFFSKRSISVNLEDLVKSFHFSFFRFYLQTVASMYSRERASQSLPKISQ